MLRKLFHEYLFKLVVALLVTGTITAFALINRIWNWPNAVVGGLLLICSVLHLMDRAGIGPSLKSRVRDWLDASGYAVQTIQDPNEFHFRMTDNIGIVVDIFQTTASSPISIVSAKHKATPAQLATFNAKSVPEQREFWKNVRLELLRYRIAFSDLSLDGDGIALREDLVPSRSLTAIEFLNRVLFVRSGARLYWELLDDLNDHASSNPAINSTVPQQTTNDPKRQLPA